MLEAPHAVSLAFLVRCLACGTMRIVRRTPTRGLERPNCPLCGYVGWTETDPAAASAA
ncbi:MAG: hypothetical protein WD249_05135 [Gaiellaceae bacterium]